MPPGRTSISWIVVVKPFGPHHFTTCSGSVIASQTISRGASTTRVRRNSRSEGLAGSSLLFAATSSLLLEFPEVFVQAVEALLPEPSIVSDPVGDLAERIGAQRAELPAAEPPFLDEPRALQAGDVL